MITVKRYGDDDMPQDNINSQLIGVGSFQYINKNDIEETIHQMNTLEDEKNVLLKVGFETLKTIFDNENKQKNTISKSTLTDDETQVIKIISNHPSKVPYKISGPTNYLSNLFVNSLENKEIGIEQQSCLIKIVCIAHSLDHIATKIGQGFSRGSFTVDGEKLYNYFLFLATILNNHEDPFLKSTTTLVTPRDPKNGQSSHYKKGEVQLGFDVRLNENEYSRVSLPHENSHLLVGSILVNGKKGCFIKIEPIGIAFMAEKVTHGMDYLQSGHTCEKDRREKDLPAEFVSFYNAYFNDPIKTITGKNSQKALHEYWKEIEDDNALIRNGKDEINTCKSETYNQIGKWATERYKDTAVLNRLQGNEVFLDQDIILKVANEYLQPSKTNQERIALQTSIDLSVSSSQKFDWSLNNQWGEKISDSIDSLLNSVDELPQLKFYKLEEDNQKLVNDFEAIKLLNETLTANLNDKDIIINQLNTKLGLQESFISNQNNSINKLTDALNDEKESNAKLNNTINNQSMTIAENQKLIAMLNDNLNTQTTIIAGNQNLISMLNERINAQSEIIEENELRNQSFLKKTFKLFDQNRFVASLGATASGAALAFISKPFGIWFVPVLKQGVITVCENLNPQDMSQIANKESEFISPGTITAAAGFAAGVTVVLGFNLYKASQNRINVDEDIIRLNQALRY